MDQPPLTVRRWTRAEYDRLVDLGVFHADPVELIGGQVIVAEPQNSAHATALGAADDALRAALPPGFMVRAQMPLALDEESAPEPDLAVVPGRRADYRARHPGRPVLVVEVADASLRFDRREKGSLYARAGVPEYWIVNLIDRVLEIHRDPISDPGATHGWRYRTMDRLDRGATAEPSALPGTRVAAADLLP
jgi:Uma2 family endonuclease